MPVGNLVLADPEPGQRGATRRNGLDALSAIDAGITEAMPCYGFQMNQGNRLPKGSRSGQTSSRRSSPARLSRVRFAAQPLAPSRETATRPSPNVKRAVLSPGMLWSEPLRLGQEGESGLIPMSLESIEMSGLPMRWCMHSVDAPEAVEPRTISQPKMFPGTRACIDSVAGRVVSGATRSYLHDHTEAKRLNIGGTVRSNRIGLHDYDRKCSSSGSLPYLFDNGTSAQVLLEINGALFGTAHQATSFRVRSSAC